MTDTTDTTKDVVVQSHGVERISETMLPTRHGTFVCTVFRSRRDDEEHVALRFGVVGPSEAPIVRVHSECLTGDVFGSRRCDCGSQLDDAMSTIVRAGAGVIVYLRGHEGRGIGLGQKVLAYGLQDQGRDTVDANIELGHPVDSRDYSAAASILAQLGLDAVRLISNNPEKVDSLERSGVRVIELVSIPSRVTPENLHYLRTKRDRLGHKVVGLDSPVPPGRPPTAVR